MFDICKLWQNRLWSFKYTKFAWFLPKNQHIQRKSLNFEFWINGKLSVSAKIWLSKSISYVKNHSNHSQFYSWKNTNLGAYFLLLTFFDEINFQITLLLKWCPISDGSLFIQNSKFNNYLWVCWFLCNNLSAFLEPPRENFPTRTAIMYMVVTHRRPRWLIRFGRKRRANCLPCSCTLKQQHDA